MKIENRKLEIRQIDKKLGKMKPMGAVEVPDWGWIHVLRRALRMSLRQLAKRMNITVQSIKEIEDREANGSITLRSLREVADALGLKLVYGFIPKEGSLQEMLEKQATTVAKTIVLRTAKTMELEAQNVSEKRLNEAIKEKTEEILRIMPTYLWD